MIRYLLALLALAVTSSQSQKVPVGMINFFGTKGMDVEKARAVLPFHQGDEIPDDQSPVFYSHPELEKEIRGALKNALGQEPTDVTIFCCSKKWGYVIFIGLGGANSHFPTIAAPTGNTCLSKEAIRISDDAINAAVEAQHRATETGDMRLGGEDDSKGYAVSNEPDARAKQMVARQYAVHHERSIERALLSCGKAEQRRAAGFLLGYSLKSKRQIAALVHAGHDPDDEVRNNAVRSLYVLAHSSSKTASEIPVQGLMDLLNSGIYSDRNKALHFFDVLTSARDPELLRRLRSECLPSLIEMARWREGRLSQTILGRIAGIDEARIDQLTKDGKGEDLITAVESMH
jgi:hypothetical protein